MLEESVLSAQTGIENQLRMYGLVHGGPSIGELIFKIKEMQAIVDVADSSNRRFEQMYKDVNQKCYDLQLSIVELKRESTRQFEDMRLKLNADLTNFELENIKRELAMIKSTHSSQQKANFEQVFAGKYSITQESTQSGTSKGRKLQELANTIEHKPV